MSRFHILQETGIYLLTLCFWPVLFSSSNTYFFALRFWHSEWKSPVTPWFAAQSSRAFLSGTTTATRKDSKLFPYTQICCRKRGKKHKIHKIRRKCLACVCSTSYELARGIPKSQEGNADTRSRHSLRQHIHLEKA